MNRFEIDLFNAVLDNVKNYYIDNYDEQRFGLRKISVLDKIYAILSRRGLSRILNSDVVNWCDGFRGYRDYFAGLDYLYNHLQNECSRKLLVDVFAYRIMGERKVKLPYNNKYRSCIERIDHNRIKKIKPMRLSFLGWELPCYDLAHLGYDLKIHFLSGGIYNTFVYHQYLEKDEGITVNSGDVVIDAGGCYGDTALLFSRLSGERGKVFSFEFVDENVKVFNRNIELNNAENITIVNKAIWSSSNTQLQFSINGPGTSAVSASENQVKVNIGTTTIDDFASENKLDRIDFIKMDIEGSELEALRGSVDVIRKYRPKLAISVYHKITDFYDIVHFIESMKLGYKFYLKHGSMHTEETVLLCKSTN